MRLPPSSATPLSNALLLAQSFLLLAIDRPQPSSPSLEGIYVHTSYCSCFSVSTTLLCLHPIGRPITAASSTVRLLPLPFGNSWRGTDLIFPFNPGRAAVRGGKEFANVHELIMHAYNYHQNPDSRIEHLGLHKALCVMMGWNYAKAPDSSKEYQSLSADEARANKDDLILWPPTVIIHNTNTGKRKDGRMDGLSSKEMDIKLKVTGDAEFSQ